jgi:hypothetical protein
MLHACVRIRASTLMCESSLAPCSNEVCVTCWRARGTSHKCATTHFRTCYAQCAQTLHPVIYWGCMCVQETWDAPGQDNQGSTNLQHHLGTSRHARHQACAPLYSPRARSIMRHHACQGRGHLHGSRRRRSCSGCHYQGQGPRGGEGEIPGDSITQPQNRNACIHARTFSSQDGKVA